MHRFRFAVAARCLKLPLREALPAASALGVQGVQFDVREELPPTALSETGRRDFLHLVSELGLSIASTTLPLRHPLYAPHELDRRVAAVRKAMEFTSQLRARTLCLRIGRIPTEADAPDRKLIRELLADLAAYGNHVGVALALTPVNDAAEPLRDLLAEIQTGPVGVDFDPAHCAMTGRSTTEWLRTVHPFVLHVQLRDGVRELDGAGVECAVGSGAVDWVELLALLGEMDYAGWLTALRSQGQDPAGDVGRAIRYVNRLLLGT